MKMCEIRLDAYADGELAASEVVAVESHLAGCAACREELTRIRAMGGMISQISAGEMSAPAMNRMRMAVASASEAARLRRMGRMAAALVGVAACVAVVGAIMSFSGEPAGRHVNVAAVDETLMDESVVANSKDSSVADWMMAQLSGSRSEVSGEH